MRMHDGMDDGGGFWPWPAGRLGGIQGLSAAAVSEETGCISALGNELRSVFWIEF